MPKDKKIQEADKLGPILKHYRLFMNASKRRTMLVQYPNRQPGQEYCDAQRSKPLELRIKPKCGLVEVDIPVNIYANFDKEKAIDYGEAMRNSRILQQGGSYGLSGGLGVGPKSSAKDHRRAPLPEGPSKEKLLENIDDANNKGHVMNKLTLGGQIHPFSDGDPIYMIATFTRDICTFTKLDAMVQLRPQFDHVDALRDRDKSTSRADRGTEDSGGDEPEETEAKAVNMAVKSAENLEELDMYGGMSVTNKLLKAMHDEPWQKLRWIDQDDQESFHVYEQDLVYHDPDNASQLVSEMTDQQYLDTVSCPRVDPKKQGAKILGGEDTSSTTEEQSPVDLGEDTEEEATAGEDGKEKFVTVPADFITPKYNIQRKIEGVCRRLSTDCNRSDAELRYMENKIRQAIKHRPDFCFMDPGNGHYEYYKWRLAENLAGRGIGPKYDFA